MAKGWQEQLQGWPEVTSFGSLRAPIAAEFIRESRPLPAALWQSLTGFADEHKLGWPDLLLAGLSGLWLVWRLGVWERFTDPLGWWWMHGMVVVWTLFALMLYVLEPFVLPRVFARLAERDPVALMTRVQRLHRVLLGVSLLVVLGAVAGSHGGWMF